MRKKKSTRRSQIIKFSALLKESWKLTKANLKTLLIIVFIFQLFPQLLSDLSKLLSAPWNALFGFLMVVPLMIAPVYAQISIYFLIDKRKAGRSPGVLDIILDVSDRFLPCLGTMVLVVLGSVVGFALLVAPGIALATYWAFAMVIVTLRGRGVIDSLKDSWRIVRGSWWKVFWYGMAVFMLVLLVEAVLVGWIYPINKIVMFTALGYVSSLAGIFVTVAMVVLFLSIEKAKGYRYE